MSSVRVCGQYPFDLNNIYTFEIKPAEFIGLYSLYMLGG